MAQLLWLAHLTAFACLLNALLSVLMFIWTEPPQRPPPGAVPAIA